MKKYEKPQIEIMIIADKEVFTDSDDVRLPFDHFML